MLKTDTDTGEFMQLLISVERSENPSLERDAVCGNCAMNTGRDSVNPICGGVLDINQDITNGHGARE